MEGRGAAGPLPPAGSLASENVSSTVDLITLSDISAMEDNGEEVTMTPRTSSEQPNPLTDAHADSPVSENISHTMLPQSPKKPEIQVCLVHTYTECQV